MRMRTLVWIPLIAVFGCSDAGPPSFDLPALGSDGKADESTTELTLGDRDANGASAEWTGTLPADGQAAVAVIDFWTRESVVDVEIEVDSGEPHLYVRNADDGSTSLEVHGEATTASGSFGIVEDMGGGRHQLALFVTKSGGGSFVVRIRQNTACTSDSDDAEPNETATTAAEATQGIHSGIVCNGADSQDWDYFFLNVDRPDRTVRVGFHHVEGFGQLNLVVDGPFGPATLTRTERMGTSISGEVVVAIDRAFEAPPMGSEYVIGVWGDDLWNVYRLMTCLDDGLEDDGGPNGNQDEESAVELAMGTTYQRAVLCPVMGAEYSAAEPDDVDYYAVDVPADVGLRIRADSIRNLELLGPADAIEVFEGTFELSPSPTGRRVVFGLTTRYLDRPTEYDLTVEAI